MNMNLLRLLKLATYMAPDGDGGGGPGAGGTGGKPADGEGGKPADGEGGGDGDLVEITVGKKKMKVDAGTAALVNALNESHAEQLDALRSQLPKKPAAKKAGGEGEGEGEGGEGKQLSKAKLAKMIFEDPEAFIDHFAESMVGRVTGMYQQTEAQKSFWSEFYKANPKLQKADMLVKAVLSRDWADLENLPASKAREELAKRAKKEMLDLGMKVAEENGEGEGDGEGGKPAAEGGSERGSRGPGAGGGEGGGKGKVLTLTGVLRNRAADRMAKAGGGKQKTG